MNGLSSFWPERASVHAGQVDLLMWGFTAVTALLAGPVLILTLWFAVKYRRGKPADRSRPVNRNTLVEVSWSVGPFLVTIGFFVYAAWLYFGLQRPPADAMTIDVVAKQWMWKFQHPRGQREIDDLHVPVGQAVKLVMTSEDVIHSLFLPALRIKQDVLPGRYTTMWFKSDRPGVYRLVCTQFCGAEHSVMGGRFFVMTPTDYERWLRTSAVDASLAGQGAALYRRLGCSACHDAGSSVHAPPLAGVAGAPVPLEGGSTVIADGQYLRDAILLPNKQVVAGYAPAMPTYANLIKEDEVVTLVAYIQSLGASAPSVGSADSSPVNGGAADSPPLRSGGGGPSGGRGRGPAPPPAEGGAR